MSYLMKHADMKRGFTSGFSNIVGRTLQRIPGTSANRMAKAVRAESTSKHLYRNDKAVGLRNPNKTLGGRALAAGNRLRDMGNSLRMSAARKAGDAKVTAQMAAAGNRGIKDGAGSGLKSTKGVKVVGSKTRKNHLGETIRTRVVSRGGSEFKSPASVRNAQLGSSRMGPQKPVSAPGAAQPKTNAGVQNVKAKQQPGGAARINTGGSSLGVNSIKDTSSRLKEKFESQ